MQALALHVGDQFSYPQQMGWASVLKGVDDKELARVCQLFRTIIRMKETKPLAFAPCSFKQMPSFRLFQAAGVAGKDAVLPREFLYKAIQLVNFEQFSATLKQFLTLIKPDFPSAQKLTVPLGARVIFKGDLHGDFRSLNLFVEGLRQQGEMENDSYKFKRDFYLIFLGDYVDRGLWGVEVIHLLMQLKLANPERVFLVRGNHEDPEMANNLGFRQEYEAKFGKRQEYAQVTAFYDALPVVLYLKSGSHAIRCHHGGEEWGYNPCQLLNSDQIHEKIQELKRQTLAPDLPVDGEQSLKQLSHDFVPVTPTKPHKMGFQFFEYHVNGIQSITYDNNRDVFTTNEALTRALFKVASTGQCQLFAAIRAHQHAPTNALMQQLLKRKGCVKLWHAYNGDDVSLTAGSVLTMLLTPDSDSGITERERQQFTFDTTIIVTTGAAIQDWRCQRINHPVFH